MESTEKQILELIAMDRIEIPVSSMSGKMKRRKPNLAKAIDLSQYGGSFKGDRAYARIKKEDKDKARGMREGIEAFSEKFPKYGRILQGIIDEKRTLSETHLYFGINPGRKLASGAKSEQQRERIILRRE